MPWTDVTNEARTSWDLLEKDTSAQIESPCRVKDGAILLPPMDALLRLADAVCQCCRRAFELLVCAEAGGNVYVLPRHGTSRRGTGRARWDPGVEPREPGRPRGGGGSLRVTQP